jgi:hypothetical protein
VRDNGTASGSACGNGYRSGHRLAARLVACGSANSWWLGGWLGQRLGMRVGLDLPNKDSEHAADPTNLIQQGSIGILQVSATLQREQFVLRFIRGAEGLSQKLQELPIAVQSAAFGDVLVYRAGRAA